MSAISEFRFSGRIVMAAAVIFGFTLCAQGGNKYVRQGASGTGSGGDWANAYPSLPSSLTRGDTYYIASGAYGAYDFNTATSGTTLITIRKAIASDHGTDLGWQKSYGEGAAVFNTNNREAFRFSTGYWVVDGQTGGGPSSWTSGFGFKAINAGSDAVVVVASGSDNVTVRHVEIRGNGGIVTPQANDCVGLDNCKNTVIAYCYIHDAGRCLFAGASSDTTIEYCYGGSFHSTDKQHAEIASIWNFTGGPRPVNWTVRYSVWTWLEGTGGFMMDGNGLLVYGCIFYQLNSSNGGNGAVGTWTASRLSNLKVYHCSFINLKMPAIGILTPGDTGDFRNNVVYNSEVGVGSGFNLLHHDYNYYIKVGAGPFAETHGATSAGDPFVNYSSFNFALKAGTTLGDQRISGQYNTDMFGHIGSRRGAIQ